MLAGDGGSRASDRAADCHLSRTLHGQECGEDLLRARARPRPRNADAFRPAAAPGGAAPHAAHSGRRGANRCLDRTAQTGASAMKYRILLILPFVIVAAYVAVCLAIGDGPARPI